MSNDLRDKGIEIANEAVQADNAGQYESAIQKYCKAAEYLLTATKYEKNPVTLKTIREKCIEYTSRAEQLKKGLDASKNPKKAAAGGGGGKNDEEDEDSGPDEEAEPLTEEQLKQAEAEMEEELAKLVGMEAVKADMRKLCKQLSLDIRRRQQGHAVLDSIRHMMFTGNPGVGKTTVSRLVAKLYKQLGVSSKDHVIEVQKGDLVAGYVNQTAMKTAKKIKEARGGILFVDEAYQLTQALQRGQSDFSGEAIDEMMKVMNESGRKAVTFVFAGYQKEMGEFIQYNAGLESRIKYKFHFADYTVPELVTITNIKLKAKGYKLAPDAQTAMPGIIDKGTDAVLRSKYNGRLTDNLIQWAGDEMNTRLSLDADGDQLITLTKSDLATAIGRFATARPPVKKDPALLGGEQVESQLSSHSYHRTIPTHDSDSPSYSPIPTAGRVPAQDLEPHRVQSVLHQGGVPQPDRPRPHGGEGHPRARPHEGRRCPPRDVARDAAQAGAPPDEPRDGCAVHRPRHPGHAHVARQARARRVCQGLRPPPHRLRGARRPHVRRRPRDRDLGGGAAAQGVPRDRAVARRARCQEGGGDPRAHAGRRGGTAREPRLARRRRPAARAGEGGEQPEVIRKVR